MFARLLAPLTFIAAVGCLSGCVVSSADDVGPDPAAPQTAATGSATTGASDAPTGVPGPDPNALASAIARLNPSANPTASANPAASTRPTGSRAEGAACSLGGDCQSGICEGLGCGADAGKCVGTQRICTRDLRAYCGCDGKTFRGSGSCPGRTFSKRAPCEAP